MLLPTLEWLVALLILETLSEECCLRIRRSAVWLLPFPGEQSKACQPLSPRTQSSGPRNGLLWLQGTCIPRCWLWEPRTDNDYTLFHIGTITLHSTEWRLESLRNIPNTSSLLWQTGDMLLNTAVCPSRSSFNHFSLATLGMAPRSPVISPPLIATFLFYLPPCDPLCTKPMSLRPSSLGLQDSSPFTLYC